MPVPDNRASFKEIWCWDPNSDQDHCNGHDDQRNHGVHYYAKWTIVGGARCRMSISHMDQCKQHQHSEAHRNDQLQSAQLWLAIGSCVCQNCFQRNILNKVVHRIGAYGKTRCRDRTPAWSPKLARPRVDASSTSSLDRVNSSSECRRQKQVLG